MSNFTIAHDLPGRMRIRYGKNIFTSIQGEVLKNDLYAWPMMQEVEVNSVTGSVLMLYDKAQKVSIPWWRSHPIHENRATESIWTEPWNPLLRATKSTKRATSTY